MKNGVSSRYYIQELNYSELTYTFVRRHDFDCSSISACLFLCFVMCILLSMCVYEYTHESERKKGIMTMCIIDLNENKAKSIWVAKRPNILL